MPTPTTFTDPRFGAFTLDPSVNWLEGRATWGSTPIELTLRMDGCTDPREILTTAAALWDAQSSWSTRITDYAVSQLLDLKNDTWSDDEADKVTAAQFAAKMTLRSITLEKDGVFEFWHDDGDMFGGHSIMVSGTLQDGPTDADIPG